MIIITTRRRLRDEIAKEMADMVETDPVTRGLVARVARSVAKDWVQDVVEQMGQPFDVGSHRHLRGPAAGPAASAARVSANSENPEFSTSEEAQNNG